MIGKVAILFLVVAAVSGNPAANTKWRWIPKSVSVNPKIKALPIEDLEGLVNVPVRPAREPVTERVLVDNCGIAPLAPAGDTKIVGGVVAAPHEFPWQVAVFIDDKFFCGGSIISNDYIMCAGHCLHDAKFVQVVVGAHNISADEPTQQTYNSTDFFTHENYTSLTVHNDISMIKLPESLVFNDYIQPVCLPTAGEEDLGPGITVTPSGWGLTSDSAIRIADEVHKVDVPTITTEVCAETYGNLIVTDNLICIDGAGGHGTCNGDSGGPLNYKTNGITETRGITSFGSSAGCESGAPDAFTRVHHYIDWIFANTGVTRM